MATPSNNPEDGGEGLTNQDLLDLHEDILEQSEEGVREILDEFAEDEEALQKLLTTEAEIVPTDDDHEMNRIPLTSIHRAALLDSEVILSILLNYHPDGGVDLRLTRNGYTPLHVATLGGVMPTLNYLTTNDACLDATGHNGSTPMHMAASKGFVDIARLLVVRGASIMGQDKWNRTPLHLAAEKGHVSTVAFFLKRNADVNARDSKGQTPLHVAQFKGHNEVTRLLLGKRAEVDSVDTEGNTPLLARIQHWTSTVEPEDDDSMASDDADNNNKQKTKSALELLLAKGACVNVANNLGNTALHLAAKTFDLDLVEQLLDFEAKIDVCDDSGMTPLFGVRDPDMCEMFLENEADVDICDKQGNTLLHMYAGCDDVTTEIMTHVVDAGLGVNVKNKHGETALHIACKCGNDSKFQFLISRGAKLHALDSSGKSMVHVSLENGHLELAQALLSKGAVSYDIQDKDGMSLLHYAVIQNAQKIVDILVRKMASVNVKDCQERTPTTLAAELKHDTILRAILSHGGLLKSEYGEGPYLRYASTGEQNMVCNLLQQGVSINTSDVTNGQTGLHYAIAGKAKSVIRLLQSMGANSSLQDKKGQTPLHFSCIHLPTDDQVLQDILTPKNVNIQDELLRTALHFGLAHMSMETLVKFLNAGGDVNLCDSNGKTPLFSLVEDSECLDQTKDSVLSYIFEHAKCTDLNMKDNEGQTVLHAAAGLGNIQTVQTLLANGASAQVVDNSGNTPLHSACENGHAKITSFLLDADADINAQNIQNDSPLFKAVSSKSLDTVEILTSSPNIDLNVICSDGRAALHQAIFERNYDICDCILDLQVSLDIADNDGCTPLHLAARLSTPAVVATMVSRDAPLSATSVNNRTALHDACMNPNSQVLEKLLTKGASVDIDIKDSDGNTPLHLASKRGSYEHVDLLLTNGANTDIINNVGNTPLHIATKSPETDLIEMLVANESDVEIRNDAGLTALHCALMHGNSEGAMIMLDQGASVQVQDKKGDSVLHFAARMQKIDLTLMKALVKRGAKLDKTNNKNETVVSILKRRKDIDVEKTAATLGIDPF